MSVTIKDIARVLGISHSTVSRGLNDSPLVAKDTKDKIKKAAEELGFHFNANARSLSTKVIGTIGIICPENYGEFGPGLFYGSLLNELRHTLEKAKLDIIVSFIYNQYTNENNIERLVVTKKIDGLIIVAPDINYIGKDVLDYMEASEVPYVFLHHNHSLPKSNNADVFYTDNFMGGYLAAKHLIEIGHKNIMTISSYANSKEFNERTRGYLEALNKYGLKKNEECIFYGQSDINSGYNIINENLKFIRDNNITAIFAQSDLMAIGCIEAFKEHGILVPNDISMVGFDDLDLIMSFKPHLTTIHQPREELAILSCERLIQLINSKEEKKKINIMLKPKLIVRDSTKPLLK